MANKIASKAQFGWRTVKYFEADSLLKGDNAEALTKKFKNAEYQAGKAIVRGRGGYSRFNTYSWGAGCGASTSMFAGKPCLECGLEGHFRRHCTTKKK